MSPNKPYTNHPSLTAVDLFAGAGGLSVGLTKAGFDVRVAVEFDKTAAKTYKLNHTQTKTIVKDIRKLTGPKILRAAGLQRSELTLLTGCPPCQGFSRLQTHRSNYNSDDPRNDLIFDILRLTRSIRPQAVMVENVPGLIKNNRFSLFIDGLKKSGYRSIYRIVDAQHFGVPQRRKRLILIATRTGTLPSNLFNPTGKSSTVRKAIGDLLPHGMSGDLLHDLPERRSEGVMQRIRATPSDGGSRSDLPPDISGCDCHVNFNGYRDVYGRMAWESVSPTITSGCNNPSKGRFLHPTEHRAITLREAALLQTFPPHYQFALDRGKGHVARQIGNAFPPGLIQPILTRLKSSL